MAVFVRLHSSLEWEITCSILIKHHELISLIKIQLLTEHCVDRLFALFSSAHCEISLVKNCVRYKCIFKHWIYLLIRPCVVFIVHSKIVCCLKRCAQLVHCVRRQKDLCSVMYKFAPCRYDWVDGAFQQHLAWQQGQDRKKYTQDYSWCKRAVVT